MTQEQKDNQSLRMKEMHAQKKALKEGMEAIAQTEDSPQTPPQTPEIASTNTEVQELREMVKTLANKLEETLNPDTQKSIMDKYMQGEKHSLFLSTYNDVPVIGYKEDRKGNRVMEERNEFNPTQMQKYVILELSDGTEVKLNYPQYLSELVPHKCFIMSQQTEKKREMQGMTATVEEANGRHVEGDDVPVVVTSEVNTYTIDFRGEHISIHEDVANMVAK